MRFSYSLFTLVIVSMILSPASAENWEFDPAMLNSKNVDLSLFNQDIQLPGTYRVDIFVNEIRITTKDVKFTVKKDNDSKSYLSPCLHNDELSTYGVKIEKFGKISQSNECINIKDISPVTFSFNFNAMKLILNVPQAYLRNDETGIADPVLWDDGINAALLNYTINLNHNNYREDDGTSSVTNSGYVQLNPGINIGPWRLRNQTNWLKQGDTHSSKWQSVYSYAERGLNSIKSRLILGDSTTPSDIFDQVPFRGVMLASDEDMIPFSQRAFAPIVKGIARTNARVEVKQNGYVVYSTIVTAGPFALSDLTTSGAEGGDFQVTVYESDGTVQKYTVPFQTPAIAVKEGYIKYSMMAGKYRPADSLTEPSPVSQFSIIYGLPNNLTFYSGMQLANHYSAYATGLGMSLGMLGAVSFDTIWSRGQAKGQSFGDGNATRIRYSKDVVATNTSFSLANYQYYSGKFMTLSDTLNTWQKKEESPDNHIRKAESSVSMNQSFNEYGVLSLNRIRTDYKNGEGHTTSSGISYGLTVAKDISLSLNWTETQNERGVTGNSPRHEKTLNFWMSIPLQRLLKTNSDINATYQLIADKKTHQELGVNGDSIDHQLHWNVRQQRVSDSSSTDSDTSTADLMWYGTYGQIGSNYSYSSNMRQEGISISGGALLHKNGITFSQPLGDTIALVKAPGAGGVAVLGNHGVKTDIRGYTTDYAQMPYQKNIVSLDPLSMSDDIEIEQTDVNVVPTRGAVVLAQFNPRIGSKAIFLLRRTDGKIISFGSLVTVDGLEGNSGIVGEEGTVYLTGLPSEGVLSVNEGKYTCHVRYRIPEYKSNSEMNNISEVCK